ncbi:MAG: sulfatase-like hydrolase/transferase, partial [Planctomycetota bacterium]
MSFRITVLAACVMMSAVLHADQTPPNVLVIVADDMGWGDIGYHSSHVYTPNLDRLAAQGAKLNQHYVMPQCTPTRLALFTGRYPGRFGTTGLQAANEPLIPHGTMTLATLLRDHGYETALTGKWHMGSSPQHGPNHHGFEYSYGALAGAVGAYVHTYRAAQIENPYSITWHRNHKIIPGYENGKHVTDLVTDEAIEFIERDREKPFFLYLPYFAPHTPLDERGKFVKLPTQLDPDRPGRWLNEDKIEWFNDPEGIIQKETDAERRLFLAVVHHLDHAIGRVIDALDESGQRDNTIILFTSDNGPQVNWGGGSYPSDLRLTDFNQPIPFRGSKTQVYEGGMRVPGFVHWQGTIPTAEIDSVHHVIDWIPTIAKLTGCDAEVPEGQPELDGVDFSSELLGDVSKVAEPRDIYGLHRPNTDKWSLRHGQWKIVHYGRKPQSIEQWQLFNLESDPAEKTDIAKENAGQLERLHERFLAQRAKDLVRANHPFVVGEIDPEQSDWFKKYKKQENVPKANEQLL